MKTTSPSDSFDLSPFVLKFALRMNILNISYTLGREERGYIGRGRERRGEIVSGIYSTESKLLVLAWLVYQND